MSNSNIVPIVYSSFIDKFVTVKKNSYGSKDRLYKAAQAKWNELKANKPIILHINLILRNILFLSISFL